MSSLNGALSVTINGTRREVPAVATMLEALDAAGASVPRLCFDERVKPVGACRLCVVSVEGRPHPVASCAEALEDGMVIETHTPELEGLRRTNLALIAHRYPAEAARAEPDQAFHRLLARYGVEPGRGRQDVYQDDSHPYLGLEMERCVNCYLCVSICEEVQGADVWQVWERGPETRVAPREGKSLLDAGCVSCGACSDVCPTGAIFDKREKPAEKWTRSTCVYCGVGCQLDVGTANGKVVAVRPPSPAKSAPVNAGHLCVKGRYAFEFNHHPDRVTTPMLRGSSKESWREASWDEALDETASRLRAILERHGPDSIGVLGSSRATNEENYYAQKFARVVLGTHNVDCCARVCHQPTATAMKTILGTGAATNSFDDIERARTIFIFGCNPTENHPIVGARIAQAVRRAVNGARLIVADPRRIELAGIADIHLQVRPGGNIPLLNALAATIIEEDLVDRDFIASRVDGFDAFAAALADFAPEAAAEACGVPAGMIRAAARMYAQNRPSMCFHGLGATEHLQGTEGVMALVYLALLTGNIGRPGTGINPLRGQNNVQGAAHMGCEPVTLPGAQSLADSATRERFEKAWGAKLSPSRGLHLLHMMDAAHKGELKALWIIGYDIYLTLANESATAEALEKIDLVVIQDLFMNVTAERFGHVFLPAASVFEKDGTFMNSDRRVQRVRATLPPAGRSKPDAWIIAQIASRLDFGDQFAHGSAEAIWDEVRSLWPGGAGLSYERLNRGDIHWPCPDESHPGTPILHGERFAHAERTELRPIPHAPSPETTDERFPFRLTTGRNLYQFNAGTMTQRTENTSLRSRDELEVAPPDAEALGLRDGDMVAVESRHGRIELSVRIMDRIRSGELFTSFHHPDLFVNRVTSPVRDRMVQAPEYKLTAVRIARI
ncbi:MAG: formate dehydrogenase subunit alpha [Phycisphaeraceae bacterium]|nr:MAG: formate dehydrogenase subunit alpha [Phycisphaeraceae bacterium]